MRLTLGYGDVLTMNDRRFVATDWVDVDVRAVETSDRLHELQTDENPEEYAPLRPSSGSGFWLFFCGLLFGWAIS